MRGCAVRVRSTCSGVNPAQFMYSWKTFTLQFPKLTLICCDLVGLCPPAYIPNSQTAMPNGITYGKLTTVPLVNITVQYMLQMMADKQAMPLFA